VRRQRGDVGETLIEILLTVFLTGLTITALLSSMATAGNAGNVQRSSVQMDVLMRNYAEATKAAVEGCVTGGTFTVVLPPVPVGFALPSPVSVPCPVVTAPVKLNLTVTGPLGLTETMPLWIRTP
jgi:hypothetical protein